MTKFWTYFDSDTKSIVVIFGTDEEIVADALEGDYSECNPNDYEKFCKLQDILEDTGSLCEEYLIDSKYKAISDIKIVNNIVEAEGFVLDERLKDCGWN